MKHSKLTDKVKDLHPDKLEMCVINTNHSQGHPFMIGAIHIKNSPGMYLDHKVAPCQFKGCRKSYEEHTYDTILVVKPLDRDLWEDSKALQHILKEVCDNVVPETEGKVAFIKPKWIEDEQEA